MTITRGKVHVTFDEEEGPGGEYLWADIDSDNHTAIVQNVPFFCDDFTYLSVVSIDDNNEVTGVVSHKFAAAGLIVFDDGVDDDKMRQVATALEALGASVERGAGPFHAIAVPTDKREEIEKLISGSPIKVYEVGELTT